MSYLTWLRNNDPDITTRRVRNVVATRELVAEYDAEADRRRLAAY